MSTVNADQSNGDKRFGHCNNKVGKNQYKDRPSPDDPRVAELLRDYHYKGITDRTQVSKLLLEEHGIILSESSISRRKRKLGLKASHFTTLELNVTVKRQLILDQMAKDPKGRLGARMVKQGILRDTGIHLTRDYIREEMKNLDPAAHAARGPAHVKEKRRLKELASQDISVSSSAEPSQRHPNSNPPTHTVPLNLPSSSILSSQPHTNPVPLSAVARPVNTDVDEDSDVSDIDSYPNSFDDSAQPIPPHNTHPNHGPDVHPGSLQAMTSPSITVALGILRHIVPQIDAVTWILKDLDAEKGVVLDSEARNLVNRGMEAAVFLERQLARTASRTQP